MVLASEPPTIATGVTPTLSLHTTLTRLRTSGSSSRLCSPPSAVASLTGSRTSDPRSLLAASSSNSPTARPTKSSLLKSSSSCASIARANMNAAPMTRGELTTNASATQESSVANSTRMTGEPTPITAFAIVLLIAALLIPGSTTKETAVHAIAKKSAAHRMVTNIPTTNTVLAIPIRPAASTLVTPTATTLSTAYARARNNAVLDRPGEKIFSALAIP